MRGKALFDRLAAGLGLVVVSPLLLALAVAIRIEEGGPVLFRQERVGRGGQPFVCYKFRTMRHDAESLLQQWEASNHPNWTRYVDSNFKLHDDPRVTRVGRFLRRTSLDELPQLWNIVRGDMSLVGPRPLLAREIGDYGENAFRHYCQLRPGLTGLWQVSGRSDVSFTQRAELDMAYFERQSWHTDLRLLVRTVKVLFSRQGAY